MTRSLSLVAGAAGRGLSKTRLGESEALRRSDALKTTILRAVSHDLRSPLTAILASATALRRTDLTLDNEDRRELVDMIVEEARRLERLVNDMLDLSRLQARTPNPGGTVWSVDQILVQALDAMGPAAARVEVPRPGETSMWVRVDCRQIERVLANVLENALRYSPAGDVVRVRVHGSRSEVLVRVIDHGPGVAAHELQRIFEPFYRGSGIDKGPGAGLGLAIARGFADANGGRLWAETREGQGAAFVLALPRADLRALANP